MKKKSAEKEPESLPPCDDKNSNSPHRTLRGSREEQQKKSILELLGREENDRYNESLPPKKRRSSFQDSFVFALFKAIFLVFILIILMYLIKPHSAHIFMDVKKITQLTPTMENTYSAEIVNCSGINEDYYDGTNFHIKSLNKAISISADSEMVIEGDITVNGIHDPDEIIVLRPLQLEDQPYNISSSCVILEGDFDSILLNEVSVENYYYFSAKSIRFFGSDHVRLGVSDSDVYIENKKDHTKDRKIDLNQEQIEINSSSGVTHIKITTRNNPSEKPLFTYFNCNSIEALNVSMFHATVTGNATISYTPTASEYSLNAQEVILKNTSNRDLNFVITDVSNYKGKLFGYITDGSISLFSIFPSLRTWFFSDVLLAPATLLTVILTAISIFVKKKKEED